MIEILPCLERQFGHKYLAQSTDWEVMSNLEGYYIVDTDLLQKDETYRIVI